MAKPGRKAWIIAAFLVVLTNLLVTAQQTRKVDNDALKNSGKTGEDWLTYGLTLAETRYSPLKQIDTTNVGRMGLAWTYDIPNPGGGQEATPLLSNGLLYSVGSRSITFAVDARTGKEKWHYDPEVKGTGFGASRGLAIYEDKIFVAVTDGRLVALNADTGAVVWSVQTTPIDAGYSVSIAPRIARGKVLLGNSGGESPVRGFVSAYDANTGELAWRFYTIPGDPAKGFESEAMKKAAETWSGEWYKMGGGGTVWDSMTYDPDLNLVYFGTGNGGPWPEELRQSKGKDNLYIASVLALDADTGAYKWHFQFTPGDSWDFDAVQQLTLADLQINGRNRRVIMQANKNGFFYVLDRTNGEFISGQPYARLNWASGVDRKTGRPIVNTEARYGAQIVCISPYAGGAHNWSPMSFNPATGLAYVPTRSSSSTGLSLVNDFVYDPKKQNIGAEFRGYCPEEGETPDPARGTPGLRPPSIGPVRTTPQGQRGTEWLVAWDPVTQEERWSAFGGPGGTVTTAGNLVFQTVGGHLIAYSADKGEKLLDVPTSNTTDTNLAAGPPITFMLDGKQYVVFSRNGSNGGRGQQAPQGAALIPARVYAFVLDGKTPLP